MQDVGAKEHIICCRVCVCPPIYKFLYHFLLGKTCACLARQCGRNTKKIEFKIVYIAVALTLLCHILGHPIGGLTRCLLPSSKRRRCSWWNAS